METFNFNESKTNFYDLLEEFNKNNKKDVFKLDKNIELYQNVPIVINYRNVFTINTFCIEYSINNFCLVYANIKINYMKV